jgi:integrase
MIVLAAFAGMRVHEIAKIRGSDVDLTGGLLYIVGKGGKAASIPLHPKIAEVAVDMPREGYWFTTHVGNNQHGGRGSGPDRSVPILPRSVSTLIGMAMTRAGIPGGTAHRLRHWYGTGIVEHGGNVIEAQRALRHASIATTQLYVRVGANRLRDAVFRLSAGDPDDSEHDQAS